MGHQKHIRIVQDLTDDEVKEIKWLLKNTNMNDYEIATHFNIGYSGVYSIRSSRRFKHIETPVERLPFFKVVQPTKTPRTSTMNVIYLNMQAKQPKQINRTYET